MSDPDASAGSVQFDIGEVFFSRTDKRGIIRAGNTVFRRVADFDWPELLGAPHKIVRHPDMPKAVFRILWDRIQAGRLTCAYVKNRTKGGQSYWVFAVVTPIEDGYLSVRVKPTSPLFARVQQVYAAHLARETEEDLSPEGSAAAMLETIRGLGYADYDAFMAAAISTELKQRDAAIGQVESERYGLLRRLSEQTEELGGQCDGLTRQFEAIRAVPINLGIAAASLGDDGRPIAVIAENYAMMCREVFKKLATLESDGSGGHSAIARAAVLAMNLGGCAQVLEEASAAFAAEQETIPVDRAEEIGRLTALAARMKEMALDSLRGVCTELAVLAMTFGDLERLVAGLDVTRILCRVEGGRLPPARAADLIDIIESLDTFHTGLSERLAHLDQLTEAMNATGGALGADERRAVRRQAA